MIDIQDLSENELDALSEKYKKLRGKQQKTKTKRKPKPAQALANPSEPRAKSAVNGVATKTRTVNAKSKKEKL